MKSPFSFKIEFGPIRIKTPIKPKIKPNNFRLWNFSSSIKKRDNGSTKRGTTAIEIPANPLETNCCPQLNIENGKTFENKPMPKQWDEGEKFYEK